MAVDVCAVCGGGPLAAAVRAGDRNRRLSNAHFIYYRCRRCGTLQLLPIPADLDRYYPPDYYAIPASIDALRAACGAERYKLGLVRRFLPEGRVVEIGPAVGAFALTMQEAGYGVSVIEMDAACCRFLREMVGLPVHETADPVAALAAAGSLDVVALWHVIEHLPNPREVIAAAARSLRPGGILIVAAPNPQALQFRLLGSRWTHLDAPRHLALIPPAQLVALGRSLGLELGLLTTVDEGTLAWNRFGWRESLAGSLRGRYGRFALRRVGSLLSFVAGPIERRDALGSTYTIVLRKPDLR